MPPRPALSEIRVISCTRVFLSKRAGSNITIILFVIGSSFTPRTPPIFAREGRKNGEQAMQSTVWTVKDTSCGFPAGISGIVSISASPQNLGLNLLNVREFVVTLTDERAMATAANIGLSSTPVTM